MSIIESFSVKNFRGIESIEDVACSNFNIFIGDNGTGKTSILDAINYAFSPSFLSGRVKHSDFYCETSESICINVSFSESIKANLPDGYAEQEVYCNKVSLTIKRRERKTSGKVFSDSVTVDHILLPNFDRGADGWTVKRKNGSDFNFTERSLGINSVHTNELPRSFNYGKSRDRQLYKGYNTSFSTIVDDFNWRFAKSMRKGNPVNEGEVDLRELIKQLENEIHAKIDFDKNEVIKEFKKRTQKLLQDSINLSLLDAAAPYENAFFSKQIGEATLPIKNLGSGIEFIISLLFLETLASLSKESLIILIDEPELHLHPNLQEVLAKYLLELSAKMQIFVTTHSPIFFKYLIGKKGVKQFICAKEEEHVNISEFNLDEGLFPWSPSWGEINYLAYTFPTIEFHNELYGYLQKISKLEKIKEFDDYLKGIHKIPQNIIWLKEIKGKEPMQQYVTLPTFIRHKIHHPENTLMKEKKISKKQLVESIESLIKTIRKKDF